MSKRITILFTANALLIAVLVALSIFQGQVALQLLLGLAFIFNLFLLRPLAFRGGYGRKSEESPEYSELENLAQLRMDVIEALAVAIDAKDQTTPGHVRRTRTYALELGKLFRLPESDLEALRAGALLHDVGKLAVPEYILNKPGKLTPAEFEKMKTHASAGAEIIGRVSFPYPVKEIVRSHHERWDGSGYPDGLKGEEIPLPARIIAVVDFYDSTRCERPYREGMQKRESLALLREMSGSSFDPEIVEAFVSNVEAFDRLISEEDLREQLSDGLEATVQDSLSNVDARESQSTPVTFLANERKVEGKDSGLRSIAQAQREAFALHEVAQTIGASLNLQDTAALIIGRLRAIVPFDICVIYLLDEVCEFVRAAYRTGDGSEAFESFLFDSSKGLAGGVIANGRTAQRGFSELDSHDLPLELLGVIHSAIASPLLNDRGCFGAIALFSVERDTYSSERALLLEAVARRASNALDNALIHERTKESALFDSITKLPNARALSLTLEQRLAEFQRTRQGQLSVLSINLDGFREVNEKSGHGIGDRVLAAVADVIRKQLRQMDSLARIKGDQFAAALPLTPRDAAQAVAERIRAAVEAENFQTHSSERLRLGLSVGVASYPDDGDIAEDILSAAERNMRLDKHARKLSLKSTGLSLSRPDVSH